MAEDAEKVQVDAAREEIARSERGYDAVAVDGGMGDWASDFNIQPTEDPEEDTELGSAS